jgi:hypothetical protein
VKYPWILVAAALLAGACHHGPTAPTVTDLSFGAASVTLQRYESIHVSLLQKRANGTTEDVTTSATWSSSAPDVVTAQAGVLTAVGVGTATITASYAGQAASIAVDARRNLYYRADLLISDTRNAPTIERVECFVDGRQTCSQSTGPYVSKTASMGVSYSLGTTPGSHTLTVRVTKALQTEARYASRGDGHLDVTDANTQEHLGRVWARRGARRPIAGVTSTRARQASGDPANASYRRSIWTIPGRIPPVTGVAGPPSNCRHLSSLLHAALPKQSSPAVRSRHIERSMP